MAERICMKGDLERLEGFLKQLAPSPNGMADMSGKGMLFYHGDADGVCSAALFLRFYKGFKYSPRKGPAMGEDFVNMVLRKRPGLLVFLDMAVDQERGDLERFLKEIPGLRIIIIDHHIAESDMNSERVVHINPRFLKKDAYIPAACAVYRLLEGLGKDVRPLLWIAALGVIGDYYWKDCPDLIEECRKEYPYLLRGEPLESRLGEGADMIAAATTLKGLSGVAECLKTIMASDGFEDFGSVRMLKDWKGEFDEEFQAMVEDFDKKRELFEKENLIVYEVRSRLSITSVMATHFGESFPDMVVAIKKADKGRWKVSLRNQAGRFNLGDLAKECSKGIGSGGGHEKAAAVMVKDWDTFLKRLRKALIRASA